MASPSKFPLNELIALIVKIDPTVFDQIDVANVTSVDVPVSQDEAADVYLPENIRASLPVVTTASSPQQNGAPNRPRPLGEQDREKAKGVVVNFVSGGSIEIPKSVAVIALVILAYVLYYTIK